MSVSAVAQPVAAPSTATMPSPAPSPQPAAHAVRVDLAYVHVASDTPGTQLELRSFVDSTEWECACTVPCNRYLRTLGAEARVTAPGMSTSNAFRIEPGPGAALVKVSGGPSLHRTLGIWGLALGVPLGLGGTAMYSYGKYQDNGGLTVAGGIVLGTGAVMILASLPLLLSGTTNVRDGKGSFIAAEPSPRL